MNTFGLSLCSRYAFPPNSLSLCGPEKQSDLTWYTISGKTDKGTTEILSQFTTLYPYLKLIASSHRIKDPFDPKVVEAYWIGNELLQGISTHAFTEHFSRTLDLKRKLPKKELFLLLIKLQNGALPNHAFHVLNVWKRTGNIDSYHSLQTMEACMIAVGSVETVLADSLIVTTKPLRYINDTLCFDTTIKRTITTLGKSDHFVKDLKKGDKVSYHWGRFVEKLTPRKVKKLEFFTKKALEFANRPNFLHDTNNFYFG